MVEIIYKKIAYAIILFALLGLVWMLNSKKIMKHADNRLVRNMVHSSLYLVCCFSFLLFESQILICCTTLVTIIGSVVGVEKSLLERVSLGNRYRDYGIVSSGIGFLLLVIFFFNQPEIVITSLLIVGFADPIASLVGRKYGTKQIRIWKGTKTIEGSISFVIVAGFILLNYMFSYGTCDAIIFYKMIIISFIMGGLEFFTPSFLDNFVLLVGGAILLNVCSYI